MAMQRSVFLTADVAMTMQMSVLFCVFVTTDIALAMQRSVFVSL